MGGNTIKNVTISRFDLNTYLIVKKIIIDYLSQHFTCSTIKEIPGKESFGDIDILYIANDSINIKNVLFAEFDISEIVVQGIVTSIAFSYESKYYQVDFIKCNLVNYEMCKFYYSYGDFGNIIGLTTSYSGIKFGHDGLFLYYYPTGNIHEPSIKIILTNKPEEICEYINIDYLKYKSGYNSLEEIFDAIINCKYFCSSIFKNDTFNHNNRKKSHTRQMFSSFIEYVEHVPIKLSNKDQEYIIKSQKEAIDYFNKQNIIDDELIKLNRNKQIKMKFNGKNLIDIGINPKNINTIMDKFKIHITSKFNISYDDYILNTEFTNIISEIKSILTI
jgi:hypothetical protein